MTEEDASAAGLRIVVGSFNEAKVREIMELLRGLPASVVALSSFSDVTPVPETGTTFAENAEQKARGLARQLHELVLADDSGLEVDALEGRPGVFSARYGGEGLSDEQRVSLLLKEMRDVPDAERTARFRCVAVLADEQTTHLTTKGVVEGRIATSAAGSSGFGYDPVFIPGGHDRTFAQLGTGVKHRMSHRARALGEFRSALDKWLQADREVG